MLYSCMYQQVVRPTLTLAAKAVQTWGSPVAYCPLEGDLSGEIHQSGQ